ncbi:MAG: hypothetical protein RSC26_14340 [Terrisporobacter sp.]
MKYISKTNFISKHKEAYIRLDHLSDRQIDYKYLEYNLYIILCKHSDDHDFSILGIPDNLEIVTYPLSKDYNIYTRTHVTLNAELWKLYMYGYFDSNESFIRFVMVAIKHYSSGRKTIKDITRFISKIRQSYIMENKDPI